MPGVLSPDGSVLSVPSAHKIREPFKLDPGYLQEPRSLAGHVGAQAFGDVRSAANVEQFITAAEHPVDGMWYDRASPLFAIFCGQGHVLSPLQIVQVLPDHSIHIRHQCAGLIDACPPDFR